MVRQLLHKMQLYGVDGKINSWLRDFLTNRKMKVVVDGEESESVGVDSGVPQDTVLGPLLFLCHINDLPDAVKSTVRLFADDCLLHRNICNMADHLALEIVNAGPSPRFKKWSGGRHGRVPKARVGEKYPLSQEKILIHWCL